MLEQGDEKSVFRFEVEINRSVCDPRGFGNLADSRRIKALGREHAHRGIQNACTLVACTGRAVSAAPSLAPCADRIFTHHWGASRPGSPGQRRASLITPKRTSPRRMTLAVGPSTY